MTGLLGTPWMVAAAGGCCPKGSCTASDLAPIQEKRNSFTTVGEKMRVQPITSPLVLIFWSPKAEVPVPSSTPPKAPGTKRWRFE